jgi:hypothetical protein
MRAALPLPMNHVIAICTNSRFNANHPFYNSAWYQSLRAPPISSSPSSTPAAMADPNNSTYTNPLDSNPQTPLQQRPNTIPRASPTPNFTEPLFSEPMPVAVNSGLAPIPQTQPTLMLSFMH